MSDLNGKFALVTGAQRGIGAAIARRLARAGARVLINAVEELDRAQTLAARLDGELVEADAVLEDVEEAVPAARSGAA